MSNEPDQDVANFQELLGFNELAQSTAWERREFFALLDWLDSIAPLPRPKIDWQHEGF